MEEEFSSRRIVSSAIVIFFRHFDQQTSNKKPVTTSTFGNISIAWLLKIMAKNEALGILLFCGTITALGREILAGEETKNRAEEMKICEKGTGNR